METSRIAKQATSELCRLLDSVDEELHLLTEELLPPLKAPPSASPATGGSLGAPEGVTSPGYSFSSEGTAAAAATGASLEADTAEQLREREERRRELMETCVGVCCSMGKELHNEISAQPPISNRTSGSSNTCSKLRAINLETLRNEMLALQALKEQLL
ncbi:hypothetical protein cyc_02253 [Cyclospora cayetanensis]|uniref:Uncharacterized protein n=1 Tax=Cyclospora cayetanensis TaxID=88456 RepID=A0A1D3D162_9EIME|nr:hypothetical protein cyc_02253 [Cyclospora cayetanensis]